MTYNTWTERNDNGDIIRINEIDHDYDCHAFGVINETTGVEIGTIYPNDVDQTDSLRYDLNHGESVHGWEDGMGNTININA